MSEHRKNKKTAKAEAQGTVSHQATCVYSNHPAVYRTISSFLSSRLRFGILDLGSFLQEDVFELDLHTFVVKLETDRTLVQLSLSGVVGEFRSQLAIDEELKLVAHSDDARRRP